MIYGNPNDFAIWFDVVPEWSNPEFIEGVFTIFIDGRILLDEKIRDSATLQVQLGDCDLILSNLKNYHGNAKTDFSNEDLYFRADHPRYIVDSDVVDNDLEPEGVEVAPMIVKDTGWDVYLFGAGDEERLIYSKDEGKTVFEKRLARGTVEKVLRSLPKLDDFQHINIMGSV